MLQYPNKFGVISNLAGIIQKMKECEIQVAVAADILSLVVLKSPGSMGADVVLGSSQRFGVPMGYGGPHAAFLLQKMTIKEICLDG